MGWRRRIAATLLAAALGACAELTADAPLFTPADQIGPPPLTEGIWISIGEHCPDYNARRRSGRFAADCTPIELSRLQDGAWQARVRMDLVYGVTRAERDEAEQSDAGPYRLIIAPAVERADSESYAPLYVVEMSPRTDSAHIGYMVVAAIGVKPATSALVTGPINCQEILRDGPIEGITVSYGTRTTEPAADESAPSTAAPPGDAPAESEPPVSGCSATTQAAVREAARRAVIENLEEMTQRRFVYVRPR